jgi:ribonucleoside-diphosphate reductase alpha chain
LSTHITKDGKVDWAMMDDTIRLGVRFLDNVLDKTDYPISDIKIISQSERRIGLGVMGLHDAMIKCGIKYSSDDAIKFTDTLFNFIKNKAYEASIYLAVEKGQFSLLDRSKFIESGFCKKSLKPAIRKKILEYGIRNCTILTEAPTGTTSIVADCSSAIEPMFAPVYRIRFNEHKDISTEMINQSSEIIVHPLLKEFISHGKDISNFEGAHEITPDQHCQIQIAAQKHIDSAVSKTINLPKNTTRDQLSGIFLKYLPSLKGMAIYKDGSKGLSPLEPIPITDAAKYINNCKIQSTDNACPKGKCEI